MANCSRTMFDVCVRLIPVLCRCSSYYTGSCLLPRRLSLSLSLSLCLSMKICAKRKVRRRKRAVAYHFLLLMVPCSSCPLFLNCDQSISLYFFKVNSSRLSFTSSLYNFLFVVLAFIFILCIFSVSELAWCPSWMLRTKPYLDLDHPSLACHSRFALSSVRITKRWRKTGRLFAPSFSCRHEVLSGTVWT